MISVTAFDKAGNASETAKIIINKTKKSEENASSNSAKSPESKENPKQVESPRLNENQKVATNNSSSHSSGAGGYFATSAPIYSEISALSNNNLAYSEAKITLSSAPQNINNSDNFSEKLVKIIENSATKSFQFSIKNPENIFEYNSTKMDYSPEEIAKILEKEWIRESENSLIRRFVVSDKMIFLEKMITLGIVKNSQKNQISEPKISANIFDEMKKLQENFIKNWRDGKFFILDITK